LVVGDAFRMMPIKFVLYKTEGGRLLMVPLKSYHLDKQEEYAEVAIIRELNSQEKYYLAGSVEKLPGGDIYEVKILK
jgi:hypothetical protein